MRCHEMSGDMKIRWGLQLRVCCYDAVMPCRIPSPNSSLEASQKNNHWSRENVEGACCALCQGSSTRTLTICFRLKYETSLYNWLMLAMRVPRNTLEHVGIHIFVNCFNMFLPFSIHLCGQFLPGYDGDLDWLGSTVQQSAVARNAECFSRSRVQSQPESQASLTMCFSWGVGYPQC